MEWKDRNVDVARELFRRGAQPAEADVHRPLLEAWLQMEKSLENEDEIQRIAERLESMHNTQKTTQTSTESPAMHDPPEKGRESDDATAPDPDPECVKQEI